MTVQEWYEAAYEYTKIQGIYVDRGDPAGFDYAKGNFVDDAAWYDLDLSAIVPEHAKAVMLQGRVDSPGVNKKIKFRRKGNANVYVGGRATTQVANVPLWFSFFVALDTNRFIRVALDVGPWTSVDVVVAGWIF